jgi:phosphate-selective porin
MGASVSEGVSSHEWRDGIERLSGSVPSIWVPGAKRRVGLESRWRSGPAGLAAEYIRSVEERRGQGVRHETLSPVPSSGWYVAGSWIVTGERKTNNVEPRRSILDGGLGAFELAGRWEAFALGAGAGAFEPILDPRADQVARRGGRGWTAGVNWYPHRWLRLQFDVIRDELTGVWVDPGGAVPSRTTRTLRMQFEL